MNVNPQSDEYGQIVPWDSLTEQQQQSGDWVKLPTHDENGEPVMARKLSMIERVFPPREQPLPDALMPMRGEFDALGKPR